MPGFDSVALHMWHIYVGGLRQLNDGTWICSDIDLARNLAESALGTFEWMRDGLGLNAPSGEGGGQQPVHRSGRHVAPDPSGGDQHRADRQAAQRG